MSRTVIKLCGFRTREDVRAAASLPVDWVGFILAPGRRRSVDPEVFPHLVREAGAERSAGVLVNPTVAEIRNWLKLAPLGLIQLCGEESPEFCREVKRKFGIRLVKVVHVHDGIGAAVSRLEEYAPWVDAFLLDSHAPEGGGSGKRFDWSRIPAWQETCRKLGRPLWVAGGLTPENVVELLAGYRPDGVDVSGGIERDGRKCPELMKRFTERVRRHEAKGGGGASA